MQRFCLLFDAEEKRNLLFTISRFYDKRMKDDWGPPTSELFWVDVEKETGLIIWRAWHLIGSAPLIQYRIQIESMSVWNFWESLVRASPLLLLLLPGGNKKPMWLCSPFLKSFLSFLLTLLKQNSVYISLENNFHMGGQRINPVLDMHAI